MKHKHKAKGGEMEPKGEKSKMNEYNAKGAPEAAEAMDEKDDFNRGGRKKKHSGHVHGHKSAKRMDKRARGGGMRSPFTEGHAGKEPGKQSSGTGSGHEDDQPGDSP